MSPEQARQVIQDAAEYIAEWKDRLRINAGRGVETWDAPTGQMVAVSPEGEEEGKEPAVLVVYLWVNTRRVTVRDPVSIPGGGLADPGGVDTETTGWYVHRELPWLAAGEYPSDYAETVFRDSELLEDLVGQPGYYRPVYRPAVDETLAPLQTASRPLPPDALIAGGALYVPEAAYTDALTGAWVLQNRTTSTVSTEIAIRGYTPEYLADRAARGLEPEFSKGVGVGRYDLILRQEDLVKGPDYYVDGGVTWGTNPRLTSNRVRVGFYPVSLTFYPLVNGPFTYSPGWTSYGEVALMSYRKV